MFVNLDAPESKGQKFAAEARRRGVLKIVSPRLRLCGNSIVSGQFDSVVDLCFTASVAAEVWLPS